jgi:hypothetical protein
MRGVQLGTVGCLMVAIFFLGHAGFALINPEYYVGSTVHLLRYVVGPASLALLFLILALTPWRGVKLQAALNALAVVVALYGFELYLSYRFLHGAVRQVADQEKAPAPDTHWAWTPGRINLALQVDRLEDAVLGHFPHARVRLCSSDYGPVVIETDRNGLNNPDTIYNSRIEGAIVGDSMLHGFCQPLGSDVAGRLRDHGANVMNAALTGSGPLKHYALIGRHLLPVRPRKVILCFFEGNDLKDLGRELRKPQSEWLAEALADEPAFGP